jgi:hypothetical protein
VSVVGYTFDGSYGQSKAAAALLHWKCSSGK